MTGRTRPTVVTVAGLVLGLAIGAPAAAQSSLQIPLQFDFLNPGAKSLAMGGAFSGVADDATAALANPAGLVQLGQFELSLEGRFQSTDTRFLRGGRLSGTIEREGLDTIDRPDFGVSRDDDFGPTFISAVMPFRYKAPGKDIDGQTRWVLAFHRHELLRVDQEFLATGVFQQDREELTSRRDSPQLGERALSITSYGLSAAYGWRRVAIGGGLAVHTFSIDSLFRRFDTVGFFGPPDQTREVGRSSQIGEDTAVSPSIGVLFGRGPRTRTRAGVLYRHGPSFNYHTVDGLLPERDVTFRVPHTLAAGVSHRPRRVPSLMLAAEVTYVNYARLVGDFVRDQALGLQREASFVVEDGIEVHGGAQYVKLDWPLSPKFRAGVWYDPDHSVQFQPQSAPQGPFERVFDERLAAALSTGESRVHGTGGVGASISPRIEANFGVDVASDSYIVSASIIVRIGS